MSRLSDHDRKLYGRQIMLPEIGETGQSVLKTKSALCIGVGGLGTVSALYLARAGIGRLGIIDIDQVETSNLHRQVLYSTADVGKSKVLVASDKLRSVDPSICIESYEEHLVGKSLENIIEKYDIVLDGTDNFSSRYEINRACVTTRKALISGAATGFEGQLITFPREEGGPCLECVFPRSSSQIEVPNCNELGVMNVLPGIIGALQASEALKFLLFRKSSKAELLWFDAIDLAFNKIDILKNKTCHVCGDKNIDHAAAAPRDDDADATISETEISVKDLSTKLASKVRVAFIEMSDLEELPSPSIQGSLVFSTSAMMFSETIELIREQSAANEEVVLICPHGMNSAQFALFFRSKGLKVKSLRGGLKKWREYHSQKATSKS